jgi:hypothetical protein
MTTMRCSIVACGRETECELIVRVGDRSLRPLTVTAKDHDLTTGRAHQQGMLVAMKSGQWLDRVRAASGFRFAATAVPSIRHPNTFARATLA